MSRYIHFTDDQKVQAHSVDITELLIRNGESVKRAGKEFEWRDGPDKVTIRGNLWFHHYEQEGGDAISFVKKFYDKTYAEAMEYLLGEGCGTLIDTSISERDIHKACDFAMPPKNDNMRRVFAYLLIQRGIDRTVLCEFARRGMIYESADYHNAVFVGFDSDGEPRHAHKRGTGSESSFKCNAAGSHPGYSFHWNGKDDTVYLFEAPIDMLSFISMNKDGWYNHSYAASCSVSDRVLFQLLKDQPNLKKVYLCLDSDKAGQAAAARISEKLFTTRGISAEVLVPQGKDWNEDLLDQDDGQEVEEECQALQL